MSPERIAAWEAWVTGRLGTERQRLQRLVDFSPFPAVREWARRRLAQLDCRREDV